MTHSRRLLPRLGATAAVLGTAALATAVALAAASPAAAASTVDNTKAATWLAGALTNGNHLEIGGFAADGTTVDAIASFVAVGGHLNSVVAMDAYLKSDATAYADPNGADPGFPGPFSGSLAKLALEAELTGQDPHAWGGFDLLGILTAKQCTAVAAGTCAAAGDYYQIFSSVSQSLAVIALNRSTVASDHQSLASASVVRLLQQQCSDGGFTSGLLDPGTTCGPGQASTSDPDATAYAAQALTTVSGAGGPLDQALKYLAAVQDPATGGFTSAAGVNANSAGLALSAFALQPATYAANITAAQSFLASLQQADGSIATSANNVGADNAKLATAQAILGVALRSLSDPTLRVALPGAAPAPTTTAPTSPSATPTTTAPSSPTTTAPTTTAPTTTAPTTTAPASTSGSAVDPGSTTSSGLDAVSVGDGRNGRGGTLANTGAAGGHLVPELALGGAALLIGGGLVVLNRRTLAARHRS